jgi:hypothetical protein
MMLSLRSQWARKLEAKAIAAEYGTAGGSVPLPDQHLARQALLQTELSSDTTLTDVDAWRTFRLEFEELRREELAGDPLNKRDRWLRASSTADMKVWHLSSGPNQGFRVRWECGRHNYLAESGIRTPSIAFDRTTV